MTYRSTLIFLLVVVFFLSLYLFETRRVEKQKKAQEAMKTLFHLQPEDLTRLALRKDNREIVLERKDGEVWEIKAPLRTPADPFALARVKNTLGALKYLRVISKEPRDLSQFGLDPPDFLISYRAGEQEGFLAFGSKSPVEDGFYARSGLGRTVYLVYGPDKIDLDKTLFDLRAKGLFTIQREGVDRLVIERPGRTWILKRVDGKWSLHGREDFAVDQERVEDLLRITLVAEALSFVREEAVDLEPYGLNPPQARVLFSDDEQSEEILYGASAENRAVYAKILGKPQVLTAPKRLIEELPETLEDLKALGLGEGKP